MFSVALLPIARRSDVVLVAFAFQDVNRIAKKQVSDFLFHAPKTVNGRFQKGRTLLILIHAGVVLFLILPSVTILGVIGFQFRTILIEPFLKFLDVFLYYSSSPIAIGSVVATTASIVFALIVLRFSLSPPE